LYLLRELVPSLSGREVFKLKLVENLLSPMTKNRSDTQPIGENDRILMERIRQHKAALVNQRLDAHNADLVRTDVINSWLRSYNNGMDPYFYNYGPVLDKYAFQERQQKKDLLLKAADPYICQLEAMLTDAIILLSDEEGTMLRVIEGNDSLRRQNERFNLVPGSVWNESTVGTCAHCISLVQGTPMQICGPEHYFEKYEEISCSSAPILDVNYNLAGSLSVVTSSFSKQSSQSLGLVVSMAWAIQSQFQLTLDNELFNLTLQATDDALIVLNKNRVITKANLAAQQMFHHITQNITGNRIERLLGEQPLIKSVIESGQAVSGAGIIIEHLNQKLLIRSVQPLNDHAGNNFGCIITVKKMERFDRPIAAKSNRKSPETRFSFDDIKGSSPGMRKTIEIARKFARSDANILLQGESGTGKEMFAQAIHSYNCTDGPFVAVNCAAIPENLIESELFGYEGGAFTGAERQGRAGKLELANGGTLFLDEIADMPLQLQPVLLRALEERKIMRLGGTRYIPVNFRLIAATNQNLHELVERGQFRSDLYYRLKVLKIDIPPLRERASDIVELAQSFISSIANKQGFFPPNLSDQATLCLLNYHWPGNVRELENAMLYAINFCEDGVIQPRDLPEEIASGVDLTSLANKDSESDPGSNLSLKEIERIMIFQALEQTNHNITEAAALLGMSRSTLYRKIKGYNLLKN
jgi:transcriptional regulator with PAS, ATPase and Fis domain